ncbi:fimbrillin family protein [Sphingobacterium sp. SGR-19]|uniref:fimbrillin family protein n=1 Tax=Sphingobacterium sp. SGR-19 TaxID=2710886 RepID=UPI0013EC688E|nr:fimbrillin family protein [Sphingobacterium sp. SGR-19]NGM65826.1 fimbrillin family protein [Sphingobacterium sp. SGR-19]
MKLIRFKRANWVVAMAMLALPGALLTSCSKETNPTEQVEPKGDKLVISVLGINDGSAGPALKAKTGSASVAKSNTMGSDNAFDVYEFADVDMAVSLGNKVPVKEANVAVRKMKNGPSANAGLKMAEEVPAGIKYVVYIYEGSTLVASAELASGTAGTIDGLDPEGEYTWVALSYNSDSAVPTLEPSSPSITLPGNTDVLHASGTVNLATDPTIGIMFDHVFSRIGIELNTMGAFGEITGTPAVNVTGIELTTGDIDLLTGEVTESSGSSPLTLTYADFENVDPAYDDAKIAYVYTAGTTAQNISVAVQGLDISHADGNLPRTYFANQATFNTTVTPVRGQSHHVLLNVVESALTTNHESTPVRWARSNLYYRGDGVNRNYAFYSQNQQTTRADGYFAFEGVEPMKFASEAEKGDPCALVYPAGLWRTPTVAEINSITTSSGVLSNVLGAILDVVLANPAPGSSLGNGYAQYSLQTAPSGENAFGSATSNQNNLRFFYNGQITNAAVLTALGDDGLAGVGLSDLSLELADVEVLDTNIPILGTSVGTIAGLWTGSRLLSGSLLTALGTSVGSQGFVAHEASALLPLGSRFVKATTTAELLGNVDLLGLDVADISLKNVRCVRAPQPAP